MEQRFVHKREKIRNDGKIVPRQVRSARAPDDDAAAVVAYRCFADDRITRSGGDDGVQVRPRMQRPPATDSRAGKSVSLRGRNDRNAGVVRILDVDRREFVEQYRLAG